MSATPPPASSPTPSPGRPELDLSADVVTLTAAVCDIESVSGDERPLADAVETALRALPHLDVDRVGNVVVARTRGERAERVLLAGHLDTVPLTDPPNLPVRLESRHGDELDEGDVLWGRGTVDMKGGVAVQLRLAATLAQPRREVTYVFYDNEEVEAAKNGLGLLAASHPQLLEGDFAVLLEPTNAQVEGGCKGTLRVDVEVPGRAAHSGRPWAGDNAVHRAGALLTKLAAFESRVVDVDGLTYHEGLSAVGIRGGVAGNVIPDRCVITVNYRFAPDLSQEQALEFVTGFFAGYEVRLTDSAPGARPGLQLPAAREFVRDLGVPVTAKEGWTDVARFAGLGIPAVNFGPGDPMLAHKDDERVPVAQLRAAEQALLRWLS